MLLFTQKSFRSLSAFIQLLIIRFEPLCYLDRLRKGNRVYWRGLVFPFSVKHVSPRAAAYWSVVV